MHSKISISSQKILGFDSNTVFFFFSLIFFFTKLECQEQETPFIDPVVYKYSENDHNPTPFQKFAYGLKAINKDYEASRDHQRDITTLLNKTLLPLFGPEKLAG